jgi:hypothetical protein
LRELEQLLEFVATGLREGDEFGREGEEVVGWERERIWNWLKDSRPLERVRISAMSSAKTYLVLMRREPEVVWLSEL